MPNNPIQPLAPLTAAVNPPALHHIRVVLVEPMGSANLGSVARAMENFGVRDLVLVNPIAEINAQARAMAVHAMGVLEQARVVSSLEEALTDTVFAVAFSGCSDTRYKDRRSYLEVVPELIAYLPSRKVSFVFGREDKGLDNLAMDHCRYVVQIPTHADYESLNLAQAVLLSLYTLFTREMVQDAVFAQSIKEESSFEEREELYEDLQKTLVQIGLIHPNAVLASMRNIRRFLERKQMSFREVKVLRGLCRQLRWAGENL